MLHPYRNWSPLQHHPSLIPGKRKSSVKKWFGNAKFLQLLEIWFPISARGRLCLGSAKDENGWNGDPLHLKLCQGKEENVKFTDIHKTERKWYPREWGPARRRKREAAFIRSLLPKLFVLRNILSCVIEEGYGGGRSAFVEDPLSCFVFL